MTSSLSSDRPVGALPFLRRTASGAQLVIGGRPRLLLGGQLHNSSASSAEHMRPVWERLAEQGIGTVIGSAGWAQVEPVEGTFDFTSVDAQIAAAAEHELHLVLIWFGAFKNAASTYAPDLGPCRTSTGSPGRSSAGARSRSSPTRAPCPSPCSACSPRSCGTPTGARSSR